MRTFRAWQVWRGGSGSASSRYRGAEAQSDALAWCSRLTSHALDARCLLANGCGQPAGWGSDLRLAYLLKLGCPGVCEAGLVGVSGPPSDADVTLAMSPIPPRGKTGQGQPEGGRSPTDKMLWHLQQVVVWSSRLCDTEACHPGKCQTVQRWLPRWEGLAIPSCANLQLSPEVYVCIQVSCHQSVFVYRAFLASIYIEPRYIGLWPACSARNDQPAQLVTSVPSEACLGP